MEYNKKDPAFFTQQIYLIGTYDEDGKARFAPISWVSYTWGNPPCLVVSIWGTKQTKENIARTGVLSATLVTPDLLPFAEQCNRGTYKESLWKQLSYTVENGTAENVPLLQGAAYSFECTILQTVEIGETVTYFAEIQNVNLSDAIKEMDFYDLRKINPVLYAGHYFTVGEHLGEIGDFSKEVE